MLREITKCLMTENLAKKEAFAFSLQTFADGLMKQSKVEPKDSQCKERVFNAIADLITLCIFLTVSPLVRAEKKDPEQAKVISDFY